MLCHRLQLERPTYRNSRKCSMNFDFDSHQQELRDHLVRFAREELNSGVDARDRDSHFDRELWQRCGKIGINGLTIDSQLGGTGADSLTAAYAIEGFGYGCRDNGLVFS